MKAFKDINGKEIKAGQTVISFPSNEKRLIKENPKKWIGGLVVCTDSSSWVLNEERAKKIEVI